MIAPCFLIEACADNLVTTETPDGFSLNSPPETTKSPLDCVTLHCLISLEAVLSHHVDEGVVHLHRRVGGGGELQAILSEPSQVPIVAWKS